MSRCKDKVEVIITDSPLLLSAFYNSSNVLGESFNQTVFNCFDSFCNMNYLLLRDKPYNPKGRLQTESKSDALKEPLLKNLNDWNIDYEVKKGNEKCYDEITNDILSWLSLR